MRQLTLMLFAVFFAAIAPAQSPECQTPCDQNPILYTYGATTPPAGATVVWQFLTSAPGWALTGTCATCPNSACTATLIWAVYGDPDSHCVHYGVSVGSPPTGGQPGRLSQAPATFQFQTQCNGPSYYLELTVSSCNGNGGAFSSVAALQCLCDD